MTKWSSIFLLALIVTACDAATRPVSCVSRGWQDVVLPNAANYVAAEKQFALTQTLYLSHGGFCESIVNFDGTGYEAMQCVGCWTDNDPASVDSMPPVKSVVPDLKHEER